MASPYKILSDKPGKSPAGQTVLIPSKIPGTDNPQVNQERSDSVPMHNPSIPWPDAPGTDKKPMKLQK